jgi:RNA polymerase sigma-70 factor, ECF subfamily
MFDIRIRRGSEEGRMDVLTARDALAKTDFEGSGDAVLVVAVGRFNREALAEIYRRHSGAVFGLARRVLGDQSMAEEVVQEVFLSLWRQPERYDPDRGTLRSYLLALTHGRSVDIVRSESARQRREERESRLRAESGYDLEREVLDLALADRVRDALSTLREEERQAIQLAYFGGHTYREVARMQGDPEGTVKTRIRMGLRNMRAVLQEAGFHES